MTSPSLFYREIPLTQGQVALVDAEDYDHLMQFKWFTFRNRQGKLYAARKKKVAVNRWTTVYMAREVMGFPKSNVDHVDVDKTLDNRKFNLRSATKSQNAANMRQRKDNTSGYKGVYWHKGAKKWTVHTRIQGKYVYVGLFVDKVEAAKAYNLIAVKLFGEFALLNEIA